MNSEPNRKGGDEDSWESLAEDLFGIDFSKSEVIDDLPPVEAIEPVILPRPAASKSPASAESPALRKDHEERPRDRDSVSSKNDLLDEKSAESPLEPSPEELQAQTADAAGDSSSSEHKDDYWDLLRDWNWDEDSRGRPPRREQEPQNRGVRQGQSGRRKGGPQGGGRTSEPVEKTQSAARTSPQPVVEENVYIEDAEFGSGVLDNRQDTRERPHVPRDREQDERYESSEGESRPQQDRSPDQEGRRRRRRRRRPRSERSEIERSPKPQTDEDGPALEDNVESEAPRRAADAESRPPRRREDRRRAKPRRVEKPDEEVEDVVDDSLDAENRDDDDLVDDDDEPIGAADEDDGDEEDGLGPKAVFNNVPTWEEAVSYLVRSRPPEPRSSEPERGPRGRSGGGDRPPGRRGSRRRR